MGGSTRRKARQRGREYAWGSRGRGRLRQELRSFPASIREKASCGVTGLAVRATSLADALSRRQPSVTQTPHSPQLKVRRFGRPPVPDPSYHGAVWTQAVKPLGPIAYIIKARVTLLRDIGAAACRM
jgi:hypothetical protein